MTVIEEMARKVAFLRRLSHEPTETDTEIAHAALRIVLARIKEPTGAMTRAGWADWKANNYKIGWDPDGCWSAMLAAFIEENEL